MLEIRLMSKDDTGFAIKHTDQLGWGYYNRDFERMIEFDPHGMFVAVQDEKPAGFVATSRYDDYAFIGPVIVEQKYRGVKIGEKLMIKAMDYLTDIGVVSIELDSVWPAASLYRRLGFQDKYFSYRVRKQVKSSGDIPDTFSSGMITDLLDFDKKMTGLYRARQLQQLSEEYPDSIFIFKDTQLRGYALVRERKGDMFWIGPMLANNYEIAEKLFKQILSRYTGSTVAMGIPETNRAFIRLIRNYGFSHTVPALRMYYGAYRNYEENVYAIIAPEKG